MSGISALRERDVVRLWKCVLFTALSDLKSCEKHQERVAAREEAEAWLRKDSPDSPPLVPPPSLDAFRNFSNRTRR